MRLAAVALALLVVAAGAAAQPEAKRGSVRTILDVDGDNLLEYGRRETFTTRRELASKTSPRSTQLIYFAQMTDTQLVDEESPIRVEFIDHLGGSFIGAYRTQEGLLPFVLNEEVRAVRAQRPELVMVTGDNADNAQLNETRWFIDILDGGVVDPNSGRRGTCGTKRTAVYDAVRGGRYYDPDRSGRADGPGYSPSQRVNRRRVGRSVASRDFPGLFAQMNRPFRATGLGRIPWYSVVGNHDALVQGNVPGNAFFSQTGTACVKVTDLSRRAWNLIRPLAAGGITLDERNEIIRILYGDFLATVSNPEKAKGLWKRIARDPQRRILFRRRDLIDAHFKSRGRPRGHGFTAANLASGEGNYAFSPKRGLRFVVVDSVADSGDQGNLDDPQFRWLHAELLAAELRRELVLVFSHHALGSMEQRAGGVHLGLEGSCPSTLSIAPTTADESVRCLLARHPSVLALVAGHSHRNRITPYPRAGGGGFWEIVTSAHTDWPQQSRGIALQDNRDSTLSIRTHVIEHLAPPRPPRVVRSRGRLLTPLQVTRLASIARELAFNNPQAENGEDGRPDRRGRPLDRNVDLVVPHPY